MAMAEIAAWLESDEAAETLSTLIRVQSGANISAADCEAILEQFGEAMEHAHGG